MELDLKALLTRRRYANLLALLVTIIMLGLTLAYWYGKKIELTERQERVFGLAVEQNYNAIKQRLTKMEVVLRGIKGHLEASEFVSQKEYHEYFNALALGEGLSGFQAVAVAISVSNESLPQYLDNMHRRGNPDFQIKPNGNRGQYAPITLIEPYAAENLNAIGFDLQTNPLVRQALFRSKISGNMMLTGKLNLVQDKGKNVAATVMYVPIYDARKPLETVADRRSAHAGWVSGPFRINDFMSSLSKELSSDLEISIYTDETRSTDSYLYGKSRQAETASSDDKHGGEEGNEGRLGFHAVKHLDVGGATWVLDIRSLPVFKKRFAETGQFPILVGFVLSFMMGWLVWLLGNGRANAVEIANEMTEELKESEATFRSMAETIPLAIYVAIGENQVSEYVNPTFVNLFGYEKDDIATVNEWWRQACPAETYYIKVVEEWKRKINETMATNSKTDPMEVVVTCKDGSKKFISWRLITLGNKIYAFGYDLTETKLAEVELQIAATAFESQSGMMVIDANQQILRVNKAFEKITGYALEEVKGLGVKFLNSGQQDEAFYKAMWKDVNNKGFWEGEVWNKRKNGEVYPEQLNITSVIKEDGIASYYVGTFNDITTSKAAAEEIENLAFYDSLTRLPNRRHLLEQLNQALAASKNNGQSGAIMFLDLDHFKTLNDTLGHDAGDLLLKKVADRLVSCVRESDTVARLGGDEFILLLQGLREQVHDSTSQVESIGFKILTALSQPYELDGNNYYSSSSIGISMFGRQQGDAGVEDLLRQADIAMYQAKASGRNTLRFFNPEMQDVISARAAMENDLRIAIKENQFQLYYQIQVDHSEKILGAEALIRWKHPDTGMVSPVQFISLAEDTGLIIPIGQWVLETACAQLVDWQDDELTQGLSISLNVSAKQFHQKDFVTQVKTTIERYGINPKLLKLELTESLLLADVDSTIAIMNGLKEVGLRFELDDFGTGYSSLQYLKRLPLSQLKIDQSFVRDIVIDSSDRAIVLTIITMAHTLGLEVIAEGVETEEQRQYLFENGCMNYQGYLFSKPLPIEQFEALIRSK
jgi:diguanylate cyclase (GGDEF)-like protein/PAS domain S-box-containing protein